MFATPYRSECRCECHQPGRDIMHVERCCKPDPSQDELTLRGLLASYAAGPLLYGDDGELQDTSEQPYIDFLRDHPTDIANKLTQRAMAKMAKMQERLVIKEFEHAYPCHPETCNCPSHILYLDNVALTGGSFKELAGLSTAVRCALMKGHG